jgi:glycopeptide antibiotics resistance protein
VAVIAFWPTPVDRPISGLLNRVLNRLHGLGAPSWFDYPFVEFSANVLLFVPIGFLVAALLGRRRAWLAVVSGGLASLAIELAQWALLPARYPSAADVLANTMGAAIGAGLLALVLTIRVRAPSR